MSWHKVYSHVAFEISNFGIDFPKLPKWRMKQIPVRTKARPLTHPHKFCNWRQRGRHDHLTTD